MSSCDHFVDRVVHAKLLGDEGVELGQQAAPHLLACPAVQRLLTFVHPDEPGQVPERGQPRVPLSQSAGRPEDGRSWGLPRPDLHEDCPQLGPPVGHGPEPAVASSGPAPRSPGHGRRRPAGTGRTVTRVLILTHAIPMFPIRIPVPIPTHPHLHPHPNRQSHPRDHRLIHIHRPSPSACPFPAGAGDGGEAGRRMGMGWGPG